MHEHSLGFTVNHFFGYPPRSIPGNGFPTVGTFSLLAFPNTDYRIPTFCRLEHQTGFPFFKILCPIWVVGVCITFKLCIAGNFSIRQPLNRVQFLPKTCPCVYGNTSLLPTISLSLDVVGATIAKVSGRYGSPFFGTLCPIPRVGNNSPIR